MCQVCSPEGVECAKCWGAPSQPPPHSGVGGGTSGDWHSGQTEIYIKKVCNIQVSILSGLSE